MLWVWVLMDHKKKREITVSRELIPEINYSDVEIDITL